MDTKKASVIIPCYNEKENILKVIGESLKSPYVGEVIVVDDGSRQTTKSILSRVEGIKLITHPHNRGKAQSLKTGLLSASYPYVAFIDADLHGFKTHHLDDLLSPVINNLCDLTISEREKELYLFRISNIGFILSGERAAKKDTFLNNLEIFNPTGFYDGYLCEVRMNQKTFDKLRIRKVIFHGVGNDYKFFKYGPLCVIQDAKILYRIISYLGPAEFRRQLSLSWKY